MYTSTTTTATIAIVPILSNNKQQQYDVCKMVLHAEIYNYFFKLMHIFLTTTNQLHNSIIQQYMQQKKKIP